ncbi:Lrp/AsnC family transcriptional regulator [Paenibacillus sp. WLX1005]|uniref:Lrp/AsnC family transcriptional regulator n=1 Tax=Paenibacillus sp. WLX1005 TaxID=3243766 RepID=UPI0039840D6E
MNLSNYMLGADEVDLRILHELIANSARSHKDIGELVHLSGQAVGQRIRKLQDMGVIEGYTVKWNPAALGQGIQGFVILYMNSASSHSSFLEHVRQQDAVHEVHRISGEGCYWMRVHAASMSDLNQLLDSLLQYGNFKLSLSVEQFK